MARSGQVLSAFWISSLQGSPGPRGMLGMGVQPSTGGASPPDRAVVALAHLPTRAVLHRVVLAAEMREVVVVAAPVVLPRLRVVDVAPGRAPLTTGESAPPVADLKPPRQIGRDTTSLATVAQHRACDRVGEDRAE